MEDLANYYWYVLEECVKGCDSKIYLLLNMKNAITNRDIIICTTILMACL